jgi:glycosyltransferase involved in cell wall biosynthesis
MAKMKIYVVDLESVPTRYTCEWKEHLPAMLRAEIAKHKLDIEVINISGGEESIEATPGAFLNFQATNIYKNNQLSDIARRFGSEINAGDKFVFADAWHTGILQLKYMSELLQIPVEIHALWHAGSYDPQDFLGRLIGNKPWVRHTEKALYNAIDHNYFATDFHVRMFMENLLNDGLKSENPWFEDDWSERYDSGKIIRTGWPMEYMADTFSRCDTSQKEDIIIFPHRVATEKQPEIFRDLAKSMPQYKFVVCQDSKLTKAEYHKLLSKSKIMWSANLQETLGISPYEGALLEVIPMLPDRLSYSEMYPKDEVDGVSNYLYPSEWTKSFNAYLKHKEAIMHMITTTIENYDLIRHDVRDSLAPHLTKNYFTATNLTNKLLGL